MPLFAPPPNSTTPSSHLSYTLTIISTVLTVLSTLMFLNSISDPDAPPSTTFYPTDLQSIMQPRMPLHRHSSAFLVFALVNAAAVISLRLLKIDVTAVGDVFDPIVVLGLYMMDYATRGQIATATPNLLCAMFNSTPNPLYSPQTLRIHLLLPLPPLPPLQHPQAPPRGLQLLRILRSTRARRAQWSVSRCQMQRDTHDRRTPRRLDCLVHRRGHVEGEQAPRTEAVERREDSVHKLPHGRDEEQPEVVVVTTEAALLQVRRAKRA